MSQDRAVEHTTDTAAHRPTRRGRGLAAATAVAASLLVASTGWAGAAPQPAVPDAGPPALTTTTGTKPIGTTPPMTTTPTTTTPTARTITSTGTGHVAAVPDVITVRIGVETRSETVSEALDQSAQRMSAVLEALRDRGVEDRDLQTSELSLSPTYGDEGTTVTGYQARNVVTARLRNVGGAGATIDAAVQAAGDAARLEGVTFSVADDQALLAEARRLAVEDAQDKAGQLADAAGVPLGMLISISEATRGGPPIPLARDEALGSVPLEPGTQQLRIDVVVVHAIG